VSNPSPTLRSAPPAPARLTRRAAAPATVLGFALVAGTLRGTPAARAAAPFEGKPWLALSYAGPDGQPQPVLPGTEITATFAEGQVAGDAGCNRYTAGYQLAQNVADIMRITPAATTLRLCPEPAGVMEQEAAYLGALTRTVRFVLAGDRFTLQTADGRLLALFMPQPQRALEGTDWSAESYNNGRGGVVSLLAGTAITARFEGGQVAGDAGCNRYTGGYTLGPGDGALSLTPAAATQRLCSEPAGVMEQEAAYLTALPTTARYRIEGDRLELVKADGALVASFRVAAAEASPPAPGTAGTGPAAVTGTLTYRERIALPPDATATVVLADVSRADAPAITLAEQTISPAGQVPISFRLEYDPAAIDPRNRYVVRGTITAGGQLLFTTAQAYPVITQGAPSDVEVVLQSV
jgi:uncharacterized lipoprotein YbaY